MIKERVVVFRHLFKNVIDKVGELGNVFFGRLIARGVNQLKWITGYQSHFYGSMQCHVQCPIDVQDGVGSKQRLFCFLSFDDLLFCGQRVIEQSGELLIVEIGDEGVSNVGKDVVDEMLFVFESQRDADFVWSDASEPVVKVL